MTHKDVKTHFQAWHDGQLDDQKRLAVEQHLKGCDRCHAYFEEMSRFLKKPDHRVQTLIGLCHQFRPP